MILQILVILKVVNFLRALSHETSEKPEKIDKKIRTKIMDIDELIKHIDTEVRKTIIGSGISVFYQNRDILFVIYTNRRNKRRDTKRDFIDF